MIRNLTRKTILAKSHTVCSSPFSKALGLMFSHKPRALVFPFSATARISLHMFFVFFPIDLVFLDSKEIVVEIKENFKPFTFYTSAEQASYVIELPAGTAGKSLTRLGDKIGL